MDSKVLLVQLLLVGVALADQIHVTQRQAPELGSRAVRQIQQPFQRQFQQPQGGFRSQPATNDFFQQALQHINERSVRPATKVNPPVQPQPQRLVLRQPLQAQQQQAVPSGLAVFQRTPVQPAQPAQPAQTIVTRIQQDEEKAALDFQKSVTDAVRLHTSRQQQDVRTRVAAPSPVPAAALAPIALAQAQNDAAVFTRSQPLSTRITVQQVQQVRAPDASIDTQQQQQRAFQQQVFQQDQQQVTQQEQQQQAFQQDQQRSFQQQVIQQEQQQQQQQAFQQEQQRVFQQDQQSVFQQEQQVQQVQRQRPVNRNRGVPARKVVVPDAPLRTQDFTQQTQTQTVKSDAAKAAEDELFHEQAKSAKYTFSSSLDDRLTDNAQVRQETRDGLNLAGLYSYSDGFFKRTVHYEADENGYRVTKEEIEPIGDGPQPDPHGSADVSAQISGADFRYSITADDIRKEREPVEQRQPQQQRQGDFAKQ